jgi:hypothetical protein
MNVCSLGGFLVLRRMWQRPFMLEHLAEITAIDAAQESACAPSSSCYWSAHPGDDL